MSVERWARLCDDYACEGACTSPHAEDAAVVAECLTEIRLLREDLGAAREASAARRETLDEVEAAMRQNARYWSHEDQGCLGENLQLLETLRSPRRAGEGEG